MSENKLKDIMENFKAEYQVMAQDANGSVGGLAILWNLTEVLFEDWVSIPQILTGKFRNLGSNVWALLLGVYGPHLLGESGAFLEMLSNLRNLYLDELCMVGGDFNMITTLGEKKGRNEKNRFRYGSLQRNH